jgi:hypothetical protein
MSQAGIRMPKPDSQQTGTLLIIILTIIFEPPAIFFLLIESPCMPPFLGSVFLVATSGECTVPRGKLQIFYGIFVVAYMWDMLLEWLMADNCFWYAVNYSFTNYIRIVHRYTSISSNLKNSNILLIFYLKDLFLSV